MVKDKLFLESISQLCLDKAKKLGTTDCEIVVGNSISESITFRNKQIEQSERSDNISIGLTTYIGKKKSNVSSSNIKEKDMQAFSLDEILNRNKYKNTKIDFLNIDVEGADLEVLEGLSFDKFKPELICLEIHDKEVKKSEIYNFLINKNYELIWSGIFSHIFKRL